MEEIQILISSFKGFSKIRGKVNSLINSWK